MNWNNEPQFADDNEDFLEYVFLFYGKSGVYDMGATMEMIISAVGDLLVEPDWDFAADSVDREKVRDIMMKQFGLTFPTKQLTIID